MKKIVIIGAGAMGSAFSIPCADNSNEVFLVGSFLEDKIIDQINNNKNQHPVLNCQLPKNVKVIKFSEFDDKMKDNIDLIVVGVSSKGIEWIGDEVSKFYNENTNILLLTKGLAVIENKFETLADKLEKILKLKGASNPKISAVGGPCLANGLANRIKSSVVLANNNIEIVKEIGKIISTSYYSTEFTDDLIGVEVCAATKNIYSMLIGASEGLSGENLDDKIKKKYYLNTAASLVYKSLSEMKKLTKKLKGKEETVFGLAGAGDMALSIWVELGPFLIIKSLTNTPSFSSYNCALMPILLDLKRFSLFNFGIIALEASKNQGLNIRLPSLQASLLNPFLP
mgnify:CR=1 FL=1